MKYIVKLGYSQTYAFDDTHANTAIKFAEIASAYRVEDDKKVEVIVEAEDKDIGGYDD